MSGVMFLVCIPSQEKERSLLKRVRSVGSATPVSSLSLKKTAKIGGDINSNHGSDNEDEGATYPQKFNRSQSENDLAVLDRSGARNKEYLYARENRVEDAETFVGEAEDQPRQSMEQRLTKCLHDLKITNAVWSSDRERQYYQISFCVAAGDVCEHILKVLSESKIGLELDSIVSVLPCSLYYEGKDKSETPKNQESIQVDFSQSQKKTYTEKELTAWEMFMNSVRARMTVAQLVCAAKTNAVLTFDFLILLIVASLSACVGLVENNTVILVASMLMSPLMGPIMAGTIGFAISDHKLQTIGILNETIGLLLCVLTGFLFGLVIGMFGRPWEIGKWPTEEMTSSAFGSCLSRYMLLLVCAKEGSTDNFQKPSMNRQNIGEVSSLLVGSVIALLSGVAVAIAVLGDNTGSLIGVAISASLMPPAVNAGILWSLAVFNIISGHIESAKDRELNVDLAVKGAISLCLTFVNIICIFVTGIVILKIKEVSPRVSNDYLRNFWKETIKIARDYNTLSNDEILISPDKKASDELSKQDRIVSDIRIPCGSVFPYSTDIGGINHTWSPSLMTYPTCPMAQELASVLHHVTLRPQHSFWAARPHFEQRPRTREPSSLHHLWSTVSPLSTSDTGSPHRFSPILERSDSHQSLSSRTLSIKRFIVTPAVSDTD